MKGRLRCRGEMLDQAVGMAAAGRTAGKVSEQVTFGLDV